MMTVFENVGVAVIVWACTYHIFHIDLEVGVIYVFITYLKQKSLPQVKKQYYANNEKSLTFSWDLDPLEVRLIEINFNPS